MATEKREVGWCATLLVSLLASGVGLAQEARPSGSSRRFPELTSELRYSVLRALNYLVSHQKRTNSFLSDRYPVAENALVGLAFLTGGYTEKEGGKDYAKSIQKCTTTLLSLQNRQGYFRDRHSRMYGHGFATLFLAELYGMSGERSAQVRNALKRAIHVIEKSQSKEGGWDYEPGVRFGGEPPTSSDTSITVCQTMALRAAKNLGLEIDLRVIQRAKSYILKAQNSDGGFSYRTGIRYARGESGFPRSAAGVCILYNLGQHSRPEVRQALRRGVRYLEKHYTDLSNPFAYYAQYYCSQAMFQVGGRHWREYFPWIRGVLLREQEDDGSWRAGHPAFSILSMETNKAQTTAMALIVLQLPYRYLPIHER